MSLFKRILRVFIIVELIILIPVILTVLNPNSHLNGGSGDGWDWSPMAFFSPMAGLLFVAGLGIDFVARKMNNLVYRIGTIIAIILVVILIWIQLVTEGAVSSAIRSIINLIF